MAISQKARYCNGFLQFIELYRGLGVFFFFYVNPFFPFYSDLVWSQNWSQLFWAREEPCLQTVLDTRAQSRRQVIG